MVSGNIMKQLFFLLVGFGVCICCGAEPQPVTATVIPEILNVRSAPDRASRIIGTLCAGESVRVLSPPDGEWCRIAMPENASVWIAASMVDAAGVPLPGALFRSGPGAAYEEIGQALQEKIEIREKAKKDKWFRIRPQQGLSAYVSSAYLKIGNSVNPSAFSSGKKPFAKKEHTEERIVESAAPAAAEGIVRRLDAGKFPASHALIVNVNSEEFISAYLAAPGINLTQWENRRVRVNGTGFWLRDRNRPLITVERIIPAWQR